jgi:hypothetical protein
MKKKKFEDIMHEDNRVGFPFLSILTLIFIFLKLFPGSPVNEWSWFWVLSPMLIPLILIGAGLALVITLYLIRQLYLWFMTVGK